MSATDARDYLLEESLGYLLSMSARLLGRAMHERMQLQGSALAHWPILMRLWQEDGLSQGDLGRRVAVEPATLTRTLDRMERDGLVTRARNPQDRREVIVRLSPRGLELRDALIPDAIAVHDMAVEGLPEAEVEALKRLLHHVIGRLSGRGFTPVWAALPGSDEEGQS
ncbi:MAG: MarR family transcriptional regulator [Alphaproteobacteria bacterium]|nr:MarR family transcriptional regulator [Alphaproteobacteria bacterium]